MAVYTDDIHLIADSLEELHAFAKEIGLTKHYFEGVRKKHPHYDLTNSVIQTKAVLNGAIVVHSKEIVSICQGRYAHKLAKGMEIKKPKKDGVYWCTWIYKGEYHLKPDGTYINAKVCNSDIMFKNGKWDGPYSVGWNGSTKAKFEDRVANLSFVDLNKSVRRSAIVCLNGIQIGECDDIKTMDLKIKSPITIPMSDVEVSRKMMEMTAVPKEYLGRKPIDDADDHARQLLKNGK